MQIEYPKAIHDMNLTVPFTRAVLHGLCYRDAEDQTDRRARNHAYSIGYWLGQMDVYQSQQWRRGMIKQKVYEISLYQLVVDEVKRLSAALKESSEIC